MTTTHAPAPDRATRRPAMTVEGIRLHFPALERRHAGHPVAYFDGPGGTQVPRVVTDAMTDYLLYHNANTHWSYPTSVETDALITRAREALADFVNGSAREIVFGMNMTTLTFHIARGLGRGWGKGDEIVITELDHHGNVAPWRALEKERGVTIRVVKMDAVTGQLDWADLQRALTPKVKLLAIGAASNALGTVNDIAGAAKLAQHVGALTFVDAVHYAPHVLVDVQALGCDFLAGSSYKFYGPHEGFVWGRESLLASLDVPRLDPAPQEAPERLETGTQGHEGMIGSGAAVDFLASIGDGPTRRARLEHAYAALHERGQALIARLWTGLAGIDGVTLYGPTPDKPRTPTLSFTVKGRTTTEVATALAERGLFLSNGDFYATTVVQRLGQAEDGIVRAGAACYTTAEEVERLIEAVAEMP